MSDREIELFEVVVDAAEVVDLRERLARTRWPDQLPATGWSLGTDRGALQELCERWRSTFDWTDFARRCNQFPQFTTAVDGQRLHFIHARSPEATARPLLITHGWPGSVAEFFDVIGPLADPVAYGGQPEDAFHVVAPSLPGYGFSGPTTELGWNIERTARAFGEVMDRLGYGRFFAQGGDWGAFVSSSLAKAFPSRVAAVQLNLVMAGPPGGNPTEEEKAAADKLATFVATESGYQGIHATKPQTVAYGLTDSPAGLAAWILEKFHGWSGPEGDRKFNPDRLLDNISIYWLTGTINSSMRMYYEMMNPITGARLTPTPLDVPLGVSRYPDEPFTAPRRWVEGTHHPASVSEPREGGHFPAMQVPDIFVEDLRAFFRSWRWT